MKVVSNCVMLNFTYHLSKYVIGQTLIFKMALVIWGPGYGWLLSSSSLLVEVQYTIWLQAEIQKHLRPET